MRHSDVEGLVHHMRMGGRHRVVDNREVGGGELDIVPPPIDFIVW